MEFREFIDAWEGKWLSQRTDFNFEHSEAANAKSDVAVSFIDAADERQAYLAGLSLPESNELILLRLSWDTSVDWGKPKQTGEVIYGFLPNVDDSRQGKFWRGALNGNVPPLQGNYHLGSDECLTLELQDPETTLSERHWYASPNLRLRTSLVQRSDGYSHSAFYSDIRRLPPKETSGT